jgi:predicted protein tyrosine phosphatase
MKNLLFICGANKLRSPTAEQVFARYENIETDSAGLKADAEQMLSAEQIDWADIVFVMEKSQRAKVARQFQKVLKGKRIICLDIPDVFTYMQAELVAMLEKKVGPYIK